MGCFNVCSVTREHKSPNPDFSSADPDEFADICLQSLSQSYSGDNEHGNILDPVHSSMLISLFAVGPRLFGSSTEN